MKDIWEMSVVLVLFGLVLVLATTCSRDMFSRLAEMFICVFALELWNAAAPGRF